VCSKRRQYSHNQKIELVKKVLGGMPAAEVAKAQGVSGSLLARWKKEYKQGKLHCCSLKQELQEMDAAVTRLQKLVEEKRRKGQVPRTST